MRCEVALSYLQDFLEERLPPRLAADLQAHLSVCHGCAAELRSWQGLWADLSGLAPAPFAPEMEQGVMAAIERLPDLPRGLVLLFALASMGTLAGMLAWAEGFEGVSGPVSACLWTIFGAVSVFSIWLAVARPHHAEGMAAVQEE